MDKEESKRRKCQYVIRLETEVKTLVAETDQLKAKVEYLRSMYEEREGKIADLKKQLSEFDH